MKKKKCKTTECSSESENKETDNLKESFVLIRTAIIIIPPIPEPVPPVPVPIPFIPEPIPFVPEPIPGIAVPIPGIAVPAGIMCVMPDMFMLPMLFMAGWLV